MALTAGSANAAQILVNFGDTAYTSDGANTWQTVDPDAANTITDNLNNGATGVGTSENWVNTGLVTTTNASSGINLDVTGVVTQNLGTGPWNNTNPNAGASQGAFDTPASGTNSGWFDTSSAEQREGVSFYDFDITYTFSGFSASDIVTFDFAVGGSSNGGDRQLTLSHVGGATLLNGVQTSNLAYYDTVSGLTGATSYSLLAQSPGGTSGQASINALRIDVVPEPSAAALLGLGGLALLRRRRK